MIIMGLLGLIMAAFVARLLKYKKTSRGVALVAVLIFFWASSGYLPDSLLSLLQTHPRLNKSAWAQTNGIIILGSGSAEWPSENLILPRTEAMPRVHEGLRQYLNCKKAAPVCVIITSGGRPRDLQVSEAQSLKNTLLEAGVPESDILTEDKSRDTEENAAMTEELLHKRTFQTLVLVTSGTHLQRANEWFQHNNLQPELAPADHLQVIFDYRLTARNLALTDVALHEILGLVEVHLKTFLAKVTVFFKTILVQ